MAGSLSKVSDILSVSIVCFGVMKNGATPKTQQILCNLGYSQQLNDICGE
jgi:hypothetical protein